MKDNFSCIEVKSLLSAYFDGELTAQKTDLIKMHLLQCPECNTELQNIYKVSSAVKTYMTNNANNLPERDMAENTIAKFEKCAEIKENLSAFIDGELDKDDVVKFCEHLLKCEYCRADYELMKSTQKAIKNYFKSSVDSLDLSESIFKENIFNKIIFFQRKRKFVYSIAVVTALLVITYFSINIINTNSGEKDNNILKVKFINKYKPNYIEGKSQLFPLPQKNAP